LLLAVVVTLGVGSSISGPLHLFLSLFLYPSLYLYLSL